MPKQKLPKERRWYVIHTYSGYEDAVARNLKQRIEALGMEDKIFNVLVPKEKKIKIRGGKKGNRRRERSTLDMSLLK
jgi:transcriptional antiterminator NusG